MIRLFVTLACVGLCAISFASPATDCYYESGAEAGYHVPKPSLTLKHPQKIKGGYSCCASVEWGMPSSVAPYKNYNCVGIVKTGCDSVNAVPATGCTRKTMVYTPDSPDDE